MNTFEPANDSPREVFMAAAAQSLQEMLPERHVLRGLQDPAALGDTMLHAGVLCLVAGSTANWTEYVGREAQYGTLEFTIVGWLHLQGEDVNPERLEQAESALEWDVLQWCQAVKTGPLLDAVYPKEVRYSGGLDNPVGWFVMTLQGGYV